MKKIIVFFVLQFKYLIFNPFWKSLANIIVIGLTFLVSALLVYFYISQYRQFVPIMPVIYSIAVFILNVLLANISYRREPMISYILLGGGLLVQILFLSFLQFTSLGSGF